MLFGTIKRFDEAKGIGSIQPEVGEGELPPGGAGRPSGKEKSSGTDLLADTPERRG